MAEIKVASYDCVEEVVKEALAKASEQTEYHEIGFVGKSDLIQDVLRTVLHNADCTIDRLDMDVCDYDDMYQLTIDEGGFVTIIPIVRGNGDYIIFSDGYLYISDEMSVTYIKDLNDRGVQYKVFGFGYENEDDSNSDSGGLEAMYSTYNRTSDPIQQLNDFMFDCFLYLTQNGVDVSKKWLSDGDV